MREREHAEDRSGSDPAEPAAAVQALVSQLQPAPDLQVEPSWPTLQTFALVRVLVSTALLAVTVGAATLPPAASAMPAPGVQVAGAPGWQASVMVPA